MKEEAIRQKLVKDLPALMKLLASLVPEESSRPLLCLVVSMLLKKMLYYVSYSEGDISTFLW